MSDCYKLTARLLIVRPEAVIAVEVYGSESSLFQKSFLVVSQNYVEFLRPDPKVTAFSLPHDVKDVVSGTLLKVINHKSPRNFRRIDGEDESWLLSPLSVCGALGQNEYSSML